MFLKIKMLKGEKRLYSTYNYIIIYGQILYSQQPTNKLF